jgi:hypothetical protein
MAYSYSFSFSSKPTGNVLPTTADLLNLFKAVELVPEFGRQGLLFKKLRDALGSAPTIPQAVSALAPFWPILDAPTKDFFFSLILTEPNQVIADIPAFLQGITDIPELHPGQPSLNPGEPPPFEKLRDAMLTDPNVVSAALCALNPCWDVLDKDIKHYCISVMTESPSGAVDLIDDLAQLAHCIPSTRELLLESLVIRANFALSAQLLIGIWSSVPTACTLEFVKAFGLNVGLNGLRHWTHDLADMISDNPGMDLTAQAQRLIIGLLTLDGIKAKDAAEIWEQRLSTVTRQLDSMQSWGDERANLMALLLDDIARACSNDSNDGADDAPEVAFPHVEWEDEDGAWHAYPISVAVPVQQALAKGEKELTIGFFSSLGNTRQLQFDLGSKHITSQFLDGSTTAKLAVRISQHENPLYHLDWKQLERAVDHKASSYLCAATLLPGSENTSLQALFDQMQAMMPDRQMHHITLLFDQEKTAVLLEKMKQFMKDGYKFDIQHCWHGTSSDAILMKILAQGLRVPGGHKNQPDVSRGSVHGDRFYGDRMSAQQVYYGQPCHGSLGVMIITPYKPGENGIPVNPEGSDPTGTFGPDHPVTGVQYPGTDWLLSKDSSLMMPTSWCCHTSLRGAIPYGPEKIIDMFLGSNNPRTLQLQADGNFVDLKGKDCTKLSEIPLGPWLIPRPSEKLPPDQEGPADSQGLGRRASLMMDWTSQNLAQSGKPSAVGKPDAIDDDDDREKRAAAKLRMRDENMRDENRKYRSWQGLCRRACLDDTPLPAIFRPKHMLQSVVDKYYQKKLGDKAAVSAQYASASDEEDTEEKTDDDDEGSDGPWRP